MNASTSIRETVPTVQCLVFVRTLCSQRAVLTQSTEITSLCRQLVSNAVSKISLYTMYLSKYLTIYSSTSNQILDPLQAKLNQILLRLLPNVHPVECLNVGTNIVQQQSPTQVNERGLFSQNKQSSVCSKSTFHQWWRLTLCVRRYLCHCVLFVNYSLLLLLQSCWNKYFNITNDLKTFLWKIYQGQKKSIFKQK